MTAAEKRVAYDLRKAGWRVLKRGWPDFLCIRSFFGDEPEIVAVEVKSPKDKVTLAQQRMHRVLLKAGVKTYVYHCDDPTVPGTNISFRFTEEDIAIITALRDKMNLSVTEVLRASIRALAAKEGIIA